eukprot:7383733-Prymnesium_polylepis.2
MLPPSAGPTPRWSKPRSGKLENKALVWYIFVAGCHTTFSFITSFCKYVGSWPFGSNRSAMHRRVLQRGTAWESVERFIKPHAKEPGQVLARLLFM